MQHSALQALKAILSACLSIGLCGAALPCLAENNKQPVLIRVGITEYQHIEDSFRDHQRLLYTLSNLSGQTNQPVTFQIAVGDYDEVLNWWNKGQIDVAIMAATPVATLMASSETAEMKLADGYLATIGERHLKEDPQRPLLRAFCGMRAEDTNCHDPLQDQRERDGARYVYRSIALINKADAGNSTEFAKIAEKNPEYLFVRSYSASGYLVPRQFLSTSLPGAQKETLKRILDDPTFTQQHATSLEQLLQHSDKPRVAFVYDSVAVPDKIHDAVIQNLLKITGTPYLDQTQIPFDAIFVNFNLPDESFKRDKQILTDLINRFNSSAPENAGSAYTQLYKSTGKYTFRRFDHWMPKYKDVVEALRTKLASSGPAMFSFTQIADELQNYSDCPKQGDCNRFPRLALVLSGGGAKCAYQAGAIEGMEEVLQDRIENCKSKGRSEDQCRKIFDISLVVGTSGGSINALFATAGNTSTKDGRHNLRRIWDSLNQNDLIQPSPRFRFWLASSVGMLQAFILTVFAGLFGRGKWSWTLFRNLLIIVAIAVLSLFFFVSGGTIVPVIVLLEILLLVFAITVTPFHNWLQKISGKKYLPGLMLALILLESGFLAWKQHELTTEMAATITAITLVAALAITIIAATVRWLMSLHEIYLGKNALRITGIAVFLFSIFKLLMVNHATRAASYNLWRFSSEIPDRYISSVQIGLVSEVFIYSCVLTWLLFTNRAVVKARHWALLVVGLLVSLFPVGISSFREMALRGAPLVLQLVAVQALVWIVMFHVHGEIRRRRSKDLHWWTVASILVFGLAVWEFAAVLGWNLINYWTPPVDHWLLHFGLLMLLVCKWTLPVPACIGLIMLFIPTVLEKQGITWNWDERRAALVGAVAAVTVLFSALVLAVLFFLEASISDSSAIAKAFIESVPSFVSGIKADGPGGSSNCARNEQPLCNYSRQIIAGTAIKRDLVITASRLHQHDPHNEVLPDDLYFYFSKLGVDAPLDFRFVPLEKNPDILLNAVIGSGTIYPVFPPRGLGKVNLKNRVGEGYQEVPDVQIVDGGFIHNSPIEAAAIWKATHIVVVEASPEEGAKLAKSFSDHIQNAFNFLFAQAQRTDLSAKGSVELFELRPDSGYFMDLMDFNPRLIESAIQSGRNDVKNPLPKFTRISAAPVFRELIPPSEAEIAAEAAKSSVTEKTQDKTGVRSN